MKGVGMTDLSHVAWRKSSRSGGDNGSCVELAHHGQAIRDSKNPSGHTLRFDHTTAAEFLAAVKNGRFDH
jgi:hypothetical protein